MLPRIYKQVSRAAYTKAPRNLTFFAISRILYSMLIKLLKKFWIAEAKLSFEPLKVDRKKCLIYGVKIIGFDSDNGRKYLPEALKKALPLYEGVKVNVDHPDDPSDTRSAYDRCGKLVNVRYVEGKGLFGDLWLNPGHRIFESVFSAAEQMPDLFGLSHNAQGEGEKEDGIFVVSKITEVRHVDLVADPATTSSLSEARKMKKTKRIKEEDEKEKDKKPMEEYDEPTKEGEEEEKKDDLASKVMDALKEADDSDEEKAQKIVDMVKEALAEADGEKDTPEAEGDEEDTEEEDTTEAEEEDTEEEDTEESARHRKSSKLEQLQEEVRSIKKEAFIRRLCEAEGLPVSRQLIEDFKPLKKTTILRHAKRLALAHKATRPRSGVPVTEAKQARIPAGQDLYNWLQN